MADSKARLGVLVSGSGTNLQAIIERCEDGYIDAYIAVVISNKKEAYALERAKKHNIAAVYIDRKSYQSSIEFNRKIKEVLLEYQVDYVIMAGYMQLLGLEVLKAFPNKVLNIHPALLPSFPGEHGIEDTFNYGVKIGGVTVHFADEEYDNGPIILQESIEIKDDMTMEQFEQEIHDIEHKIYPKAIKMLVDNRLKIEGRKVKII